MEFFFWAGVSILMMPNTGPLQQNQMTNGDPAAFLNPTAYLDYRHPSIQFTVAQLTADLQGPREKAVTIHDFVRDQILFGFEPAFYAMKASQVLAAKRGFCNTKGTLFVAMLRAVGIPARQRYFALSSSVLDGIVNPGTDYVDHAIAEVFLDGHWYQVDSFIVDPALMATAKEQLQEPIGLGIRRDGQHIWDARSHRFAQFHPDYIGQTYGVFADVGDFYRNAPNPNNRLAGLRRLFFRLGVSGINQRINQLRANSKSP